jgi:hypothetical protein
MNTQNQVAGASPKAALVQHKAPCPKGYTPPEQPGVVLQKVWDRVGESRTKGRRSHLIRMLPEAFHELKVVSGTQPVGEFLEDLLEAARRYGKPIQEMFKAQKTT